MNILTLSQIREILPAIDLISEIEQSFQAYSANQAIVPPVGEMILEKGEVHIKYGYIRHDDYYVIKIASGFYDNPALGISSGNGLMLLYNQSTGELKCILLDEGYLTNIRTAVAGAIVAKHLAPGNVKQIGIVGSGTQARMQLRYLKEVISCNKVLVWGIHRQKLEQYQKEMEQEGFSVNIAKDISTLMSECNLIVTTTPSKSPLLKANELMPGTHITAMGSDTVDKQELDPEILKKADLIIADSLEQCKERGEIFQANRNEKLNQEKIVELGQVISGKVQGRINDVQITVADLTGVAVQDIAIASAVYNALNIT